MKAEPILQEFERNYEKLANSLQVLNRRLILLHPVRLSSSLEICG